MKNIYSTPMHTSRLVLVALVVAMCGQVHSQDSKGNNREKWVDFYVPHANEVMPYRLMEPLGFDSSKRYPVIVSLHGGGGSGWFRENGNW